MNPYIVPVGPVPSTTNTLVFTHFNPDVQSHLNSRQFYGVNGGATLALAAAGLVAAAVAGMEAAMEAALAIMASSIL